MKRGKWILLAVALAVIGALVVWRAPGHEPVLGALSGREEPDRPGERSGTASGQTGALGAGPSPLDHTVRDRKVRDEMRQRILEAWVRQAGGPDPAVPPPSPGAMAPMPELADGGIDPQYIRDRVKEDFFPMAKSCYEELLARKPRAGGRIIVKFTIVGDERVGGVIDEASVDEASTLTDDKITTCFRESMMSMAFRPPPHGGKVTVTYPMDLAPDDEAEGGAAGRDAR